MTNVVKCLGVFLDEAKALPPSCILMGFCACKLMRALNIFNLTDEETSAIQRYENAEPLFFASYD